MPLSWSSLLELRKLRERGVPLVGLGEVFEVDEADAVDGDGLVEHDGEVALLPASALVVVPPLHAVEVAVPVEQQEESRERDECCVKAAYPQRRSCTCSRQPSARVATSGTRTS